MTDLNAIASSTFRYNFHSHTEFCDGRATMREFAAAAAKQGFEHYGFSPHSPLPFATSCNMTKESVTAYLSEVKRLQEEYAGRVHLYASMEIDFIDEMGPANRYYDTLPLDYRIGSIHFLRATDGSGEWIDVDGSPQKFIERLNRHFGGDIVHVVKNYYAQVQKMIEQGGFQLLGHLDKIGYNASCHTPGIEDEEWYHKLVRQTLEAALDHKLTLEINTKAWGRSGRLFPNQRYFTLIKQWDVPVVFNSDAHYPELIDHGRNEAWRLMQQAQ